MTAFTRRGFLAATAVGAAGLSGCTTSGSESSDPPADDDSGTGPPASPAGSEAADGAPTRTDAPASDPTEALPTAGGALPLPMTPAALRAEARSGGPSKDGIPSIDDPSFVAADRVDFLEGGDPVFGVARGDTAKAYPQNILVHHEICNDTVDGTPVAVTYCPLTGTVQGFERGDTTFGVSGRLINNNLVMYDRATETWWPQILATSIPGPWNEDPPTVSLREFRLVWTTWEEWRHEHPGTEVLSTDTGHVRNYGRDPYGSYNPREGYYRDGTTLYPRLATDDSHHPKTVFVGARTPEGAVAFEKRAVTDAGTMDGRLGDTPVLAVADPRYTTAYVYLNPEARSFEYEDGRLRGDGERFAPDDLPLRRVRAFDAMWFAWRGYYPDTEVYA